MGRKGVTLELPRCNTAYYPF